LNPELLSTIQELLKIQKWTLTNCWLDIDWVLVEHTVNWILW
jgi:hypothetical protein